MCYIDFLGLAWQNFFESFPGHQYFPLKGMYAIRHLLAQVSFDRKQSKWAHLPKLGRNFSIWISDQISLILFPINIAQ